MNFLQGKSPAERNKIIAVIVLGALAIITLAYTFLPGSSPKRKTTTANKEANNNSSLAQGKSNQIQLPEEIRAEELPTSIPDDPFPPTGAIESSRNIFALYDPSDKPAVAAMPALNKPSPIPSPTPPPPMVLARVNPQMVYARSKDFTLEVIGDKFTPETRILFNGQEVATQFVNAQRLTAQVSSGLISGEGQRQIMVRTPDGKLFSNVAGFMVQAPPMPNFNFVGLVARRGYNNDTATLQDKASKQYQNVRLGESIGRFKVASISSKEVVMQDNELGFRHSLTFVDEKTVSKVGTNAQSNDGSRGFQNLNPSPNMRYQPNPSMPNQYMPPPQPPTPTSTQNDEDEDDNL
jgi:hypothetical protein